MSSSSSDSDSDTAIRKNMTTKCYLMALAETYVTRSVIKQDDLEVKPLVTNFSEDDYKHLFEINLNLRNCESLIRESYEKALKNDYAFEKDEYGGYALYYKGFKKLKPDFFYRNKYLPNLFGYINKIPTETMPLITDVSLFLKTEVCNSDRLMTGATRFANHSCRPNCSFEPFQRSDGRWCIQLKKEETINYGDEITVSYGKQYFGRRNRLCKCKNIDLHPSSEISLESSLSGRGELTLTGSIPVTEASIDSVGGASSNQKEQPSSEETINYTETNNLTDLNNLASQSNKEELPCEFDNNTVAVSSKDSRGSEVEASMELTPKNKHETLLEGYVSGSLRVESSAAPSLSQISAILSETQNYSQEGIDNHFEESGLSSGYEIPDTVLSTPQNNSKEIEIGKKFLESTAIHPSSRRQTDGNLESNIKLSRNESFNSGRKRRFTLFNPARKAKKVLPFDTPSYQETETHREDEDAEKESNRSLSDTLTDESGSDSDTSCSLSEVCSNHSIGMISSESSKSSDKNILSSESSNSSDENILGAEYCSHYTEENFVLAAQLIAANHGTSNSESHDWLNLMKCAFKDKKIPEYKKVLSSEDSVRKRVHDSVIRCAQGELIFFPFLDEICLIVELNLDHILKYSFDKDEDLRLPTAVDRSTKTIHVFLIVNSDGVEAMKSSKKSYWPLWFSLPCLPPILRCKYENLVLARLWFGFGKPDWSIFFADIKNQLQGTRKINARNEVWTLSFSVSFLVADLPAKSAILNMKQFNGRFGCTLCLVQTKKNPDTATSRFYPKKLYKMRDCETHDQHIKMAQISRTKSYLGVKGIAKVSEILQNIPLSAPIDYMHQVLIGVNKVMLQLIIRRPKKEVIEIDEMVKAFKVIISLINKEFYIWIKIPPFVLKLFFNFFQ